MNRSYENPATLWHSSELSPGYADYVREQLQRTPGFDRALAKLAEGLGQEPSSSRMLLRLPINMVSGPDAARAMVAAARDLADIVQAGAFEQVTAGNTPYVLVENNSMLSGELGVPAGAKASMFPDERIGYVRAERDDVSVLFKLVLALSIPKAKHTNFYLYK